MCVIFCIDDGKFPDLETLKSAESLNSHGAGIAYIKNGTVHYEKGIDSARIHTLIKNGNIGKKAIIHFRIASIGDVSKKLCHPFPISPDAELHLSGIAPNGVLFHNGTLRDYDEYALGFIKNYGVALPNGQLSDSRVMAWLTNFYGSSWLRLLEDQKIAILTKDGIKKFGKWTKFKGHDVSNDYFDMSHRQVVTYGKGWGLGYDDYGGEFGSAYCPDCYGAYKCKLHEAKSKIILNDDKMLTEGKKKDEMLDQYTSTLDAQIDAIMTDGGLTSENIEKINEMQLQEDILADADLKPTPYTPEQIGEYVP